MTLNMLCPCRKNPKMFAYTALEGPFYFNHAPLVAPGKKIIIHEEPGKHKTWAPHSVDGLYIFPSQEH